MAKYCGHFKAQQKKFLIDNKEVSLEIENLIRRKNNPTEELENQEEQNVSQEN